MRTWAIACAIIVSLLLVFLRVEYRLAHPTVPPGVQRSECLTPPPQIESGVDWLRRLGGRVTRYPNTQWQGNAYTVADIAQGRDLTKYEVLELRDPEPRHFGETRNPTVVRARIFLWNHWRDRKRAYLVVTLTGVDNTGTSHSFVEPDDSGRWRVYRRLLDRHALVDEPTAYSVGWVTPTGRDKPGNPLPEGQTPNPTTDNLEFRDVCGETAGNF